MGEQDIAGCSEDADGAGFLDFKSFVVGSIFLGFLRHQSDIGDIAHGCDIKGSVFFAEINGGLVDPGVVPIGDDRFGIRGVAVGTPHLSGCTDHRRHGGINNHIAGDMQVGDSLVGIDHGNGGAFFNNLLQIGPNGGLGFRIERIEDTVKIGESIIGIKSDIFQCLSMGFQ